MGTTRISRTRRAVIVTVAGCALATAACGTETAARPLGTSNDRPPAATGDSREWEGSLYPRPYDKYEGSLYPESYE